MTHVLITQEILALLAV